jgi:hypothetical protein
VRKAGMIESNMPQLAGKHFFPWPNVIAKPKKFIPNALFGKF